MSHRTETGCNLTREDFHPDGDENCSDGGTPDEHPVGGRRKPKHRNKGWD